ncbi:hypothetical protein [uncultured Duncaniella sp.]|uniref:hypothetical protein n=1 Tax=uncultured Duncaniella sp. TaxID=2768039 RepID=UPI0025B6D8B7|nr:hypothetical protein [uncultured Duncaniella sp.]
MATTINLTVPKSWAELSQDQLRFLFQTMVEVQLSNRNVGFRSLDDYSLQSSAQVATICLLKWSGLRLICAYADGWLVAHDQEEFKVTAGQMASAITHLVWAKELPTEPVRLDIVDGAKAVPADISGDFTFDNWLACEALWQVYQLTSNEDMLRQMAEILYNKPDIKPDAAELLGIFYWWAAVKSMASDMFPNFFKPGEVGEAPSADSMRRNMDAQIRALTKGDITKESEILAMGAIRALTELDAQAREYDELNKKYPSKK